MLTRSWSAGAAPDLENVVFSAAPLRSYRGHKQDVLDVCWSKSLFLLTASMDKSVRLWHVSMDDCLRVFRRVSSFVFLAVRQRTHADTIPSGTKDAGSLVLLRGYFCDTLLTRHSRR